jgi:hypothetical protein
MIRLLSFGSIKQEWMVNADHANHAALSFSIGKAATRPSHERVRSVSHHTDGTCIEKGQFV